MTFVVGLCRNLHKISKKIFIYCIAHNNIALQGATYNKEIESLVKNLQQRTFVMYYFDFCKSWDQITERNVAYKYYLLPRLIRKEIITQIEHQKDILKNNHTSLK